ncbi:hypothetical protein ACQZV8_12495 [Magnetococcales bacterium HHB-1]
MTPKPYWIQQIGMLCIMLSFAISAKATEYEGDVQPAYLGNRNDDATLMGRKFGAFMNAFRQEIDNPAKSTTTPTQKTQILKRRKPNNPLLYDPWGVAHHDSALLFGYGYDPQAVAMLYGYPPYRYPPAPYTTPGWGPPPYYKPPVNLRDHISPKRPLQQKPPHQNEANAPQHTQEALSRNPWRIVKKKTPPEKKQIEQTNRTQWEYNPWSRQK